MGKSLRRYIVGVSMCLSQLDRVGEAEKAYTPISLLSTSTPKLAVSLPGLIRRLTHRQK